MAGQLLTLPARLSARAALTVVRASVAVPIRAIDLLNELRAALGSNGRQTRAPETPADRSGPVPRSEASSASRRSAQPAAAPPPPQESEVEAPREPPHVSEEPVLVEELAEPGAEDGAGASVTIDEPWEGYSRLTAKEVLGRLSGADAATLAAVELYESGGRNRRTVLEAVRRELRSKNGRT